MLTVIRSIFISIAEGAIKRFSGSGRAGETFADREYFQHYGFTSRPLPGAEGLLIKQGNVIYLIASDDRRYRIGLADGEVALYSDEGDKVHLKRGRVVEIQAGTEVLLNAPSVKLGDGTLRALIDERIKTLWADVHVHPYTDNGNPMVTGVPTVPLDLSGCSTNKTKGS